MKWLPHAFSTLLHVGFVLLRLTGRLLLRDISLELKRPLHHSVPRLTRLQSLENNTDTYSLGEDAQVRYDARS